MSDLLTSKGLNFNRRSEGDVVESKSVFLLDTIGELAQFYSLSSFSFVGGTLVNIGGHNPLEPASYRIPVILGKYTNNVEDAVEELKKVAAMVEVESVSELSREIIELSKNIDKRKSMGEAAYLVWNSNLGATKRIIDELFSLIYDNSLGKLKKQSNESI